jgi:hypothetical protein
MCPCLVDKNSSASEKAARFAFLFPVFLWLFRLDCIGTIEFLYQGFCNLCYISFFFGGNFEFLSIDQASVQPVLHGKKLFMRSLLNNDTAPENENAIRTPNGGQSVCNDDCCTVFRNPIQGCLNYLFSTHVNGAGSFIQDQDGRLLHDTSGNGKALSLATTQFGAILSHNGVVSLGKLDGEYLLGAL